MTTGIFVFSFLQLCQNSVSFNNTKNAWSMVACSIVETLKAVA